MKVNFNKDKIVLLTGNGLLRSEDFNITTGS